VQSVGIEVFSSRNELAITLCPYARQYYIQVTNTVRLWIKQVEIGPRVIDQASAIAGKVTSVEILKVTVAANIFAIRCARIDVADAFMVGKEVDTLTNPARIGNIAIQA
jgi:hypothetical protein